MGSITLFKPLCCFLLCAFGFQLTQAQTFAEWFSQKKTQIKYLTQQIAALEQYGSYTKQGYAISQNGLGNIGSYIKGEHGMHSAYYSSLATVNPQIKSNSKADSIVSYAKQIPAQFDLLHGLNGLDKDNRAYIMRVESKVIGECNKDLTELQLVMTSGEAQMTDDERIKRLDQIYGRMKDKYAFTQSFCNHVRMLLLQRNRELQDIQTLGRYNENN
jgi:hypothetical protein